MSTCEEARTEAPVVISTMAGEEEEGGSVTSILTFLPSSRFPSIPCGDMLLRILPSLPYRSDISPSNFNDLIAGARRVHQ